MFERYTERARRVIFFARYEASQFGSTTIETEHLLLGLIREDKNLTNRFLRNHSSIESIRKEIEGRTTIREKVSTSIDLPLSNECKRILAYAAEEAERLNHRHIGTEHLLLGILREEKCVAAEILHERGLRLNAIQDELARSVVDRQTLIKPKETPLLSEFSRDLTQAAMDGVLDPLVCRDAEIDRVIQILCRRTKNNPVLIGDPGVGKTAIVEGLAQRIVDGEVPSFLAEKRILVLDLSLIVAGTKYRGQFEERLKTIMKELVDNPNTVVFIDELHTLVGAGSAEGSLDAANILKPALSRGEIQCIGATTPAEYRKSIEKDRSLERRFQAVKVGAPSESEAVRILQGVKSRYEKFHMVNYTDEAIESAVYLSNRYIPDRFLPDKAIDLLDEAGARVKLRQATLPSEMTDIQRRIKFIVARMESAISSKDFEKAEHYKNQEQLERENLRNVREKFNISETTSMGVVTKADIEDVVSRWTGVPVNSIKEEEMQRLSRIEEELHRRIVSQDQAINALARAIRRSRAGLKSPHRPAGSFLFLGPTGLGNTIDFKNTIIIMTSNIGARFLSKHTSLGFQAPSEEATAQKMEDAVMQEVKRLFNPEFINRLDEIIIFNSLTNEDLSRIVDMMITQLNENLAHKRLEVSITDDAKQWILDKACRDKNYGARPLRRAIQRYIEDPLSEALIQGNLKELSKVEVYMEGGQLWYRPMDRDREEVGVPLTM